MRGHWKAAKPHECYKWLVLNGHIILLVILWLSFLDVNFIDIEHPCSRRHAFDLSEFSPLTCKTLTQSIYLGHLAHFFFFLIALFQKQTKYDNSFRSVTHKHNRSRHGMICSLSFIYWRFIFKENTRESTRWNVDTVLIRLIGFATAALKPCQVTSVLSR